MSTETQKITREQALGALDAMDDYARMAVGVDAIGPRRALERFIDQQASQAAEIDALKADIATYVCVASEQATEIEAYQDIDVNALLLALVRVGVSFDETAETARIPSVLVRGINQLTRAVEESYQSLVRERAIDAAMQTKETP